jgi:hypothetical protein
MLSTKIRELYVMSGERVQPVTASQHVGHALMHDAQ